VGEQSRTTAELIVECLENEGVTHVFGIPGEENIRLVEALSRSTINYVLTRHEQGASFIGGQCLQHAGGDHDPSRQPGQGERRQEEHDLGDSNSKGRHRNQEIACHENSAENTLEILLCCPP